MIFYLIYVISYRYLECVTSWLILCGVCVYVCFFVFFLRLYLFFVFCFFALFSEPRPETFVKAKTVYALTPDTTGLDMAAPAKTHDRCVRTQALLCGFKTGPCYFYLFIF